MKTIHCDMLVCSLLKKGDGPIDPDAGREGGFALMEATRIQNYQKRYKVYNDGLPVAEIWDENQLFPQFCAIKIENILHYKPFKPIDEIIDLFCDYFDCTYHHLMQYDIAMDSDEFIFCKNEKPAFRGYDPVTFINHMLTGRCQRVYPYKASGKDAHLITAAGKTIPQTLKLSKQNTTLKIYNKSVELKHSGKDYISESWGETSGDVWRVELSLKNKGLDVWEYNSVPLHNCKPFFNAMDRAEIFHTVIEKAFKIDIPLRGGVRLVTDILPRENEWMSHNLYYNKLRFTDFQLITPYSKGIVNFLKKVASSPIRDRYPEEVAKIERAYLSLNHLFFVAQKDGLNSGLAVPDRECQTADRV